jgi:hypothetical protein
MSEKTWKFAKPCLLHSVMHIFAAFEVLNIIFLIQELKRYTVFSVRLVSFDSLSMGCSFVTYGNNSSTIFVFSAETQIPYTDLTKYSLAVFLCISIKYTYRQLYIHKDQK